MDIAGVVVGFETELSVKDLVVAEFSPKPIATAATPAVAQMTARRIEVSCPCWLKLLLSLILLRLACNIIILIETINDVYSHPRPQRGECRMHRTQIRKRKRKKKIKTKT